VFSSYFWTWRRAGVEGWQPFLHPPASAGPVGAFNGPFAAARDSVVAKASTEALQSRPGIYEFAIAQAASRSKVVVYVGESSDIRRRHHKEYRGTHGGHLRQFFEEALGNNCTIYRRVRYMSSKEDAARTESQMLAKYNYAWNQRQNGASRRVYLTQRCSCCCAYTAVGYAPA